MESPREDALQPSTTYSDPHVRLLEAASQEKSFPGDGGKEGNNGWGWLLGAAVLTACVLGAMWTKKNLKITIQQAR